MRRPFRAGDEVEVRRAEEILATLDARGTLDGLPFMPEMLAFCGRRFRVSRRAEKSCDTIVSYKSRRMVGVVHLEGLRCTGDAHGGCQAGCLLYWKDAWLKSPGGTASPPSPRRPAVTPDGLLRLTRRPSGYDAPRDLYVCQATEMRSASSPLHWWDPRQYARELLTGNVRLGHFVRTVLRAAYNVAARRLGWLGVRPQPHVEGRPEHRPASANLGLAPGDRVRVRPLPEILETLDINQRERGLWFDVEMVPFCGREFRVSHRVERLIEEQSGRMLTIGKDCIVLEGAACGGCLSRDRLFCPRSIHCYWREGWLERAPEKEEA